jgi:death-on-curing protein
LFLQLNGHEIVVEASDAIAAMFRLAAGELSEEEVADWFRERLARLP